MPDWEVNIKKARDIPEVTLSGKDCVTSEEKCVEYTFHDKKVAIPEKHHIMYSDIFSKEKDFKDRLRAFLLAENDLGRGFKIIKDFILLFTPKWVNIGYKTVDEFIIKQIGEDMSTTNEKKTLFSRQILIFGAIFIVAILQQFGMDFGLELSPDANWVAAGSAVLGIILRIVTGRPVKLGTMLGVSDTGD